MYDPQTNRRVRIDKEIAFPNDRQSLYGDAPIKFSTDGRYAAYMINKEGRFELFVTNIETRQRTSMVSGSNWVTFAFSPDNKRIAYVDGRSTTEGGSLFVRDIDGGNRTRLDTDVWSFKFDSRGRQSILL
jgi:Tol biopolymer transport system component